MPNTTQSFNIANGDPRPNGNGAQMSRSGDGQPNQAQWHADGNDYTIGLPSAVWVVPTTDAIYEFDLDAHATSDTFALRTDAPEGLQGYTVRGASGITGGDSIPQVDVDP